MIAEKREEIRLLKSAGMSFRKLAEYTNENVSVIRTQCKDLNTVETNYQLPDLIEEKQACAYCGKPINQEGKGRPKRFCSDECRRKYWKANRDKMKQNPDAIYTKVCPYCGKTFTAYGNKHRKYCCHEHYVLDYYGPRKRA